MFQSINLWHTKGIIMTFIFKVRENCTILGKWMVENDLAKNSQSAWNYISSKNATISKVGTTCSAAFNSLRSLSLRNCYSNCCANVQNRFNLQVDKMSGRIKSAGIIKTTLLISVVVYTAFKVISFISNRVNKKVIDKDYFKFSELIKGIDEKSIETRKMERKEFTDEMLESRKKFTDEMDLQKLRFTLTVRGFKYTMENFIKQQLSSCNKMCVKLLAVTQQQIEQANRKAQVERKALLIKAARELIANELQKSKNNHIPITGMDPYNVSAEGNLFPEME